MSAQTQSDKVIMPETWQGELSALLRLGVPMALTQIIQFSIYTVDTLMIGRISPVDLAAAALGTVIYFIFWMLGSGGVMAVSPMVSQALGANKHNYDDVRLTMRMAFWAIIFITPFMMALVFFTEVISVRLGQDPEVSRKAGQYMLALAVGWPFSLFVLALRNFLASLGKTLVPLWLVIIGTALNAFLNWLLIFGVGPFPRWELVGAGVASSLSAMATFGLFVAYIAWDKEARLFEIFKGFWTPHWERLKTLFSLAWPMSVTTLFEGMLFNVAVLIMGVIGTNEQAAYHVGLNMAALAFMLPFGLSMAGAVRMGLAVGADNLAAIKRVAWVTMLTCITAMTIFAVPVATIPEVIANVYLDSSKPENKEVIALTIMFLPIAASFMFFDAAQVAANQLLRGMKDVRWPMVFTAISYWAIGFMLAYVLALKTPIGAIGVWYGLTAGLIAASIFLTARLVLMIRRINE